MDWYIDEIADEWETVREFYLNHHEKLSATREAFILDALKLSGIRVLGPADRAKHWPPGGSSAADIERLTAADGESRFMPGVTPENLGTQLQEGIIERIHTWWPPPSHAIFDIDASWTIGVSGRGPTSLVRFDCHFDSRVAHAYPITADEAQL